MSLTLALWLYGRKRCQRLDFSFIAITYDREAIASKRC